MQTYFEVDNKANWLLPMAVWEQFRMYKNHFGIFFVMYKNPCDVGMRTCVFPLWCSWNLWCLLWNLWSWDVMTFMQLVYFLFDVYGTCDVGMGSCLIPLWCLRNLWPQGCIDVYGTCWFSYWCIWKLWCRNGKLFRSLVMFMELVM